MAIQQGTVTITGFVGSMPVPFGRSGGVEGCSFRMGSTRRYRDGGTGEWRNLPTTWITVKAFRTLASNARMSLHVGEAAIVTGVLSTEEWMTQNDERRSRIVVEATNIGHDINYGVSELKKFQKSDRDAPAQGNGTPANPGLPPSPGGGTATAGAGQQADARPVHPTPVTFDNLGEETPTDNPQASQAQEFGSGFAESPLDESTTGDMRPAGEAEF
ncbi:single-stranded DNA-binding protein [Bifidobacterium bifidum]|uniref:single-stranded DNA-binding protein n=1 Tax=Bifidobacterium bifidum TaxID=1681 RepID=UPI000E50EFB3|nr:single-stranded DNA-binding protein [Bifidobacterium bifidum]RHH19098.1 single-stranded DNA-binding protein [Bifidobacterium bifidum]RHH30325.1 single-stranded DNA-binding protein [Bifidobacterium bifidum]RHH31413.1 single-stranded DNA-binding protein [Bifidobacterium bifidum]RHH36429.1 single-stranded DNA-binding protein [Bifidobacterium bifidum]